MTPEEVADLQKAAILLQKAKAKVLAKHFKKAAAHHEGHAADDEKCMMAHKAHADHHTASMEKAASDDDADDKKDDVKDAKDKAKKDYHKASASFHKAMAGFAEKMGKREKEYADHNKAMAAAAEEDDAKKLFKMLEIDESELPTIPTEAEVIPVTKTAEVPATPAAPAAAAPTPTPAPAASAPADPAPSVGFNETISKALDNKLTEAVDAAFERVLSSDDFGKKVDQAIASKLLEKLGSSTVNTEIRTFPVARPGSAASIGKVNLDGLDAELADLCKTE